MILFNNKKLMLLTSIFTVFSYTAQAQYYTAKQVYSFAKSRNYQALSRLGGYVNMQDSHGYTPLCMAIADNDTQTYNILRQYGANPQPSCLQSAFAESKNATFLGMGAVGWTVVGVLAVGGAVLEGVLTIQGNGKTVQSDGTSATGSDSIIVGNGTTAGADLIMEDVNLGNIQTGTQKASLVVKGGNQVEYKAKSGDISIKDASNGIGIYLEKDATNGAATVTLTAEGGEINISDDIRSTSKDNVVNFNGTQEINFSGTFDPATSNVNTTLNRKDGYDEAIIYSINTGGTLKYTNDTTLYDAGHHTAALMNSINFNGGVLDTRNGVVTDFNLTNMNLSGTSSFYGDVDLANQTMDKFTVTNHVTGAGKLNVAGFNLISDAAEEKTSINFTDDATLRKAVNYTGAQGLTALSPIYKYDVAYDNTNGNFDFTRYNSGGYGDYNPAIYAEPVAAQLGGYLTQLNSYDEAFSNLDTLMFTPTAELSGISSGDDVIGTQRKGNAWVRPYGMHEKVALKNGPKVSNNAYGIFAGQNSSAVEFGNGWSGVFGAYVGYNGSHQSYDGISMHQNGGTLGAVGMAYKNDFFAGLTANIGMSSAKAKTQYGNDDFDLLMTGVAAKTGYNWKLANDKFIIQPNFTMSYSYINPSNYTSAARVRINGEALEAIQLQPELKFIGNLENGWQPYASVARVWNVMDDAKFDANKVTLPEVSVKPFFKYGLGVKKTWDDRFAGYVQTNANSGGRDGVGVEAGFTWYFGK